MCKGCLSDRFFHFAHMIVENKEELGLVEDTARKIRELKIQIKKDLIRDKADIEVIGVDVLAKLWDQKIDVEGIDRLLDTKYELKKGSVKRLIRAFAMLKDLLTPEQLRKAKAICKAEKRAERTEERCCR